MCTQVYILSKTSELVLIDRSAGSPSFGNLATQSNLTSFGAMAVMPGTQGFGGMQQPQQQQQQQQQASSGFGSFGGSPQ